MNIEKTLQRLWQLIFWYLLCWIVGFGILILFEFQVFDESSPLRVPAIITAGVAALGWCGLLIAVLKTSKNIQSDKVLKQALSDDFMTLVKHKAAHFGFFGTVLFAAAMAPFGDLEAFSGTVVAELTILAGVGIYLGSWLVLLKREDSDG